MRVNREARLDGVVSKVTPQICPPLLSRLLSSRAATELPAELRPESETQAHTAGSAISCPSVSLDLFFLRILGAITPSRLWEVWNLTPLLLQKRLIILTFILSSVVHLWLNSDLEP